MCYLAVDKDGTEIISDFKPERFHDNNTWDIDANPNDDINLITLPKGSIKKLIGMIMTWENEPYKIL